MQLVASRTDGYGSWEAQGRASQEMNQWLKERSLLRDAPESRRPAGENILGGTFLTRNVTIPYPGITVDKCPCTLRKRQKWPFGHF